MGEVNEIYKPLYTSKNRYYLITGGRGSLKSSTIHDFVVRLTYEQGEGVLFTRYTMTSAEKSIIPEFLLTLDRLGVASAFEITKTKITNKLTGSFILFSGIKTSSGDQTANLKSISGITCWVIEEGEDYTDEKSFDTIDDSIRTISKQNRVIWIQNPSTREHFIYKRWLENSTKQIEIEGYNVTVTDKPEITHIHSWYGIAKQYLSHDWLAKANKAKEQQPKWYYHNYIGGWLERAEGAIFTNWTMGEFDNSLPYVYGQDYGFSVDPTTLVKVAVDEKKKIIYADEKFYSTVGMGTNEIFEANKQATKPNELIIADSAEPRLIDDLRRKGTNIIPCEKGAGSVSAGITKMQDYQIVITPTSHNLRKELSNYIWNDKKAGIPVDAFNHCFVGDTLVSTINGDVKIKDIKVGDLVLTSKGYKKVLHLFDNGVQQVENYSIQLDINYVNLCATKIHNVKTNQGWIAISKLQSGQMVYLNKSLPIRNTTFTRMKDTFHEVLQGCTLQFTNCISGIFQKVIMFITSIKILGITELKISNWCKAISIYLHMAKKGTKKIQNGLRLFTQKVLKLQNNGTHQVRAKSGTKYKANKLGLIDRTLNIIANFVGRNTKQGTQAEQSIVIKTAKLKHLEIGESKMAQVYDIMVDECHEYFANGLLVHNCIDPLRYSTMYLTKHKTSTGIRKNSLI